MNIKFTYELEHEGKLPFLDVLLCRMGKKIYTTVCRKATNNDVYLNWNALAPNSWKRATLKGALSGLRQFLATESALKFMKKFFLFHLKSSLRSQDI